MVSRVMRLWRPDLLVLLAWVQAAAKDAAGWSDPKKNSDGKVVQELKIEAPSFTEEDQYGYIMPERYRCDSCRAVMFHLEEGLSKTHPKSRRLKQWEYMEKFDDICKGGFDGYGVKLINGENTLSGPGLKKNEDSLAPGSGAIQMGGESWSKRLGEICRKLVYEKVGEEEAYEFIYKRLQGDVDPDGVDKLCRDELKECEWRPQAGPKAPPAEAKSADVKTKTKADKSKDKAKEKKAKEAAKAKAESKPKAAAAATGAASARKNADGDDKVDVQTFLRNLAVRHGLTSDEYLASRTVAEWEKLTVAMAGRIFNTASKNEL